MKYQIDTPEMRFALDFAKRAGLLIREKFGQTTTDWKQDDTPITEVDIALNQKFIEEASQRFPEYSILGEEARNETRCGLDVDYRSC